MGDPVEESFELDREGWELVALGEGVEEGDRRCVGFAGGGGDSIPHETSSLWRNVEVGIEGCGRWRMAACSTYP